MIALLSSPPKISSSVSCSSTLSSAFLRTDGLSEEPVPGTAPDDLRPEAGCPWDLPADASLRLLTEYDAVSDDRPAGVRPDTEPERPAGLPDTTVPASCDHPSGPLLTDSPVPSGNPEDTDLLPRPDVPVAALDAPAALPPEEDALRPAGACLPWADVVLIRDEPEDPDGTLPEDDLPAGLLRPADDGFLSDS